MLGLPLALLLLTQAPAEPTLAALPDTQHAGRMLHDYLMAEARRHFEARRAAVAALKTPDDLKRRQDDLRARFLRSLGAFPERTPLNARIAHRDLRDGYSVERVVFESRPGHHVTAALYLPSSPAPYPGVLVPCGHSANGKAAETYQRISISLAKNGMAALCYDPIGQGERVQLLDAAGKPALPGSTTEHTMVGVGALLVGRQAAHYRIWDGLRAMDYLASRPEIDPERLACTGNSGGGTLTAYLMALDDRIKVAAPSCYITSLERLFDTIGPQDAEQNITGQVAFGLDHADYVTLRAPKPTLICVGTRDFFDIDGAWASFREAKKVYGMIGFGERVDLFEYDDTHGFSKPRREAAMRWMRRWLLGEDDGRTEGDLAIASDADLQVTRTGQVLSDYPDGRSVVDLNAERAAALEAERAAAHASRTPDELRAAVRTRLGLPETGGEIVVDGHDRTVRRDGLTIDRWAITTEPGIQVPLILFRGEAEPEGPIVVYVGASRDLASPGGPIEARVEAGATVALIDPRGMGETVPATGNARRPGPFGADEKDAFLALHLDRPLLGQRVFDLLQALRALDGRRGFHLIGVGAGGPIALHAAALDDRIRSVELQDSVVSWTAVAKAEVSRDQLASAVPGVLESYDLPELAEAIAPRPLTVRAAVDPAGAAVDQAMLESAYRAAVSAYARRDAADRLQLRAGR